MSKETEKKLPVEQSRLVLRRGAIKAVARELCTQKRIDPDAMEPGQVRGKSDVTLSNGDPANAMWKYHTEEAKRIIDVMLEYLPQNDNSPSVGATETAMSEKLESNTPSDAATCSPSSESPPTAHPSGAWCRSDYVTQFEKLRDHLKAVVSGSFYGDTTGYFHCDPKAMRAAKAHLASLENAKGDAPGAIEKP